MKLGIIGSGMIVADLMQTAHLLPLEKVALFGRDKAKTDQFAAEHGIQETYNDYDQLLASDLDTVYIALPNHLHFSFAEKALLAGKNVILEKPVTSNLAQFQRLKALAKEQNVILIEAVTVHYLPAYQQLKTEVSKLGEIKIVSLNYSQYSSRYDRFKQGDIQPAFDPQKSGGALMDLNVYNLHFAVGIFGKPKDYVYMANISRGIDTSGILLLDYGSFKAVCIGAKDCAAPIMLSIQGDEGNVTVPMPTNAMNQYQYKPNKGEAIPHQFGSEHRMLFEFLEFIRVIDEKDVAFADKMLEISEIVCEITEKARKQQGILFAGEA